MKKVIKLTESELNTIINRVIQESNGQNFNKLVSEIHAMGDSYKDQMVSLIKDFGVKNQDLQLKISWDQELTEDEKSELRYVNKKYWDDMTNLLRFIEQSRSLN